jgi:hypothetical protein
MRHVGRIFEKSILPSCAGIPHLENELANVADVTSHEFNGRIYEKIQRFKRKIPFKNPIIKPYSDIKTEFKYTLSLKKYFTQLNDAS